MKAKTSTSNVHLKQIQYRSLKFYNCCIHLKTVYLEKNTQNSFITRSSKRTKTSGRARKAKISCGSEKSFEPVTKTINEASEDVSKTLMERSEANNKALANLNNKS